MTSSFDFAPLFPSGLPAPSARWTGLAKYSFVGGNNDSEQLPLEGLIEATNSALQKEGRSRREFSATRPAPRAACSRAA
ncbi:MAG: hypothetical protein JSV48_21910, partial [Bradyrhizobium sp.]